MLSAAFAEMGWAPPLGAHLDLTKLRRSAESSHIAGHRITRVMATLPAGDDQRMCVIGGTFYAFTFFLPMSLRSADDLDPAGDLRAVWDWYLASKQ